MRVHSVVATYLGDMQSKLKAQMEELFSKHGMNAPDAAEDIWENKERYPGFSYERLPLTHFKNSTTDERYSALEDKVIDARTEDPKTPINKLWYEIVNKHLISSDYLKYAQAWSLGKSPLQVPVSPVKYPYAITKPTYSGTPEEVSKDVSDYIRGKKFASSLIRAVVSRYLTAIQG